MCYTVWDIVTAEGHCPDGCNQVLCSVDQSTLALVMEHGKGQESVVPMCVAPTRAHINA